MEWQETLLQLLWNRRWREQGWRQRLHRKKCHPRMSDRSIFPDNRAAISGTGLCLIPFAGGRYLKFPLITRGIDVFIEWFPIMMPGQARWCHGKNMGQIRLAFPLGSCSHESGDSVKVILPNLPFPHLQNGEMTSSLHRAVMRSRDHGNHQLSLAQSRCKSYPEDSAREIVVNAAEMVFFLKDPH